MSLLSSITLDTVNDTIAGCAPYIDTGDSLFQPWGWHVAFARIGIIIGGVIGGAIAIPLMAPIVLCLLGFTCWGVVALSMAATCQSSIGNVEAGSCFAGCQSAGAGGCPRCYIFILRVLAVGGACLGGYIGYVYTCQGMEG